MIIRAKGKKEGKNKGAEVQLKGKRVFKIFAAVVLAAMLLVALGGVASAEPPNPPPACDNPKVAATNPNCGGGDDSVVVPEETTPEETTVPEGPVPQGTPGPEGTDSGHGHDGTTPGWYFHILGNNRCEDNYFEKGQKPNAEWQEGRCQVTPTPTVVPPTPTVVPPTPTVVPPTRVPEEPEAATCVPRLEINGACVPEGLVVSQWTDHDPMNYSEPTGKLVSDRPWVPGATMLIDLEPNRSYRFMGWVPGEDEWFYLFDITTPEDCDPNNPIVIKKVIFPCEGAEVAGTGVCTTSVVTSTATTQVDPPADNPDGTVDTGSVVDNFVDTADDLSDAGVLLTNFKVLDPEALLVAAKQVPCGTPEWFVAVAAFFIIITIIISWGPPLTIALIIGGTYFLRKPPKAS